MRSTRLQTVASRLIALGISAGLLLVLITLSGCSDQKAQILQPTVTRTVHVTVNKLNSAGAVAGVVPSAVISVSPDAQVSSVVTGDVKTFTLPADGVYTFSATASGYSSDTKTLTIQTTRSIDYQLSLGLIELATPTSVPTTVSEAADIVIPIKPGDELQTTSTPTLTIPAGSHLDVNGQVPATPIDVSATPVPIVTQQGLTVTTGTTQTTSNQLLLGGFSLIPAGLHSDKPITLRIPLSSLGLTDGFAAANSPFPITHYNVTTGLYENAGSATYNAATHSLDSQISQFRNASRISRDVPGGTEYFIQITLNVQITSRYLVLNSLTGTVSQPVSLTVNTTLTSTFSADYNSIVLKNLGIQDALGSTKPHSHTLVAQADNVGTLTGKQHILDIAITYGGLPVASGTVATHDVQWDEAYTPFTTGSLGH